MLPRCPKGLYVASSVLTIDFKALSGNAVAIDNDLTMNRHQGTLPPSSTTDHIVGETERYSISRIIATNSGSDRSGLCRQLRCGIVQPGKWFFPRKNGLTELYIRQIEDKLGVSRSRIWLVDDKLSNCLAFVRHGCKAIRVTPTAADSLVGDRITQRQAVEKWLLSRMTPPSIDRR